MKALYLLLAGLLSGFAAMAQYTSTTINSGLSQCALAKDVAGNIYAVREDAGSGKYTVVEYINGTGAPVTLNSSLQLDANAIEYPWGLAVSSLGDVYVTNPTPAGTDNWEIIKLTAPSYTKSVIQSGKFYSSLAIDQNNDIITTEYIDPDGTYNNGDDKYRVVKYLHTNETGAGTVLYAGVPYQEDFSYPWSLVVDDYGNIYFLDFKTNDPAPGTSNDGGQLIKLTYPAYTASVINSGKGISTLALDASNNLYTVEAVSATTSHVVKYSYPVTAGASGTALTPVTLVSAAGFYPWGMVVKGSSIFVNDATDDPATAGDPADGAFKRLDPPTIAVNSVNRVNASPTNTASVQYTVTFSGSATGVTTAAFSLTTTGLTGAAITTVSGSGTTYTVTVNTGTGDGTLRLDVNGSGISPTVTPVPYTSGQVYTIDRTFPTINTFTINSGAAFTNNPSVNLAIAATDADPVLQMAFSNDGSSYSAFEALAATKTWTLSAGDGSKTVYVMVRDRSGNFIVETDNITLDQTAPNTTITGMPPLITNSANATFTFSSDDPAATFEGALGAGALVMVTTPLTYTGLAEGPHTFSVRARDLAGNTDATPDSYTWTVDQTAPTVASIGVPANDYYHAGQNLDFTLNFSENVTVTGTPYINLTVGSTGRQAAYVSGSGTNALVFSYTVQAGEADNDGITLGTLALNGGTIQDAATNNANVTLSGVPSLAGVRVNTTIPSVVLSTTASSPRNSGFSITLSFSEAVSGLSVGDLNVLNTTVSNLQTTDNITYTMDLQPSANGVINMQLPANAVQNIGHNPNTASNTLSITYDDAVPTVTSVSVPAGGYYNTGEVLTFTVHYNENVTVAGTPQISIMIGSIIRQAVYVSGSGTNDLTFSYTIQSGELDTDGIVAGTLSTNGGSIKDAATNDADLILYNLNNTSGVRVDAVAPTVTSVSVPANGYYQNGQNLDFTVNFNENVTVTGTPTIPITIGAATVDASYISGSGTGALVFRYTVQAGEQDLDGISVGSAIALNGGTIRDIAANNTVLTLNSIGSTSGVFVYSVVPGVTISTTAPALVNALFPVTITFTEEVTGFTAADVTATNATVSNLNTSDNITYTLDVTPTADGAVSLQVPAGSAVNIASNGNITSNILNLTYDGTAPVVTTVGVPGNGYYKTGGILNFTINFSENVTVTGTPYLEVVVGSTTRNAGYVSGSGTGALVFRYTVQSGEEDMTGITLGTLQLNGGTIRDAATNNAALALNGVPATTGVRVHTAIPSVTLTTAAPALVNAPFTITATFSESMAGVALADFTVTNGTVSSLSGTANTVFTLTVTPTADGPVSINFPANKALNVAGTNNTASNTLSFTYDGTAPVITAVSVPANGYYKAGDVLSFTATFSENVTVTGTPQLGVVIGAATQQADYVSGSGANQLTFSYTVQTGDNDMDGIALGSLTLNGGTIQDAATNDAVLTLNGVPGTAGVFVNTTTATVTVSTTAVSPGNQPFTATFTFSEKVTGFTSGDITVTNGTAGATVTADNITYTALITPAADGTVTVQVPANIAVNIGNNGNAASNILTYTYDGTAPAISSVAVPANGYYKAGDVLSFTVNYSENVNVIGAGGIPSLNLTIGSSSVQAAYVSGSGTNALTFTYTVQAGEQDLDGIAIAGTMIGTIKDDAGNTAANTLSNVGNTSGVYVYTAIPTVQLSGTVQANAPFTLTITFSEAVTGFTLSDINATNATLSNQNTTDNITYTALVTPVADGLVSLQVPANAAVNVVSNSNTASNTISYTYDATAPVITSVDVPANAYYTTGQNLDFTVHMSEAVDVAGGTPSIPVTIGTTTVQANYVSGTGTNALLFRYTVLNGQMDMDGISPGAALALNGSTLRDPAGNNAVLTLNSVGSTAGVRVNTAHPTVVVATTAAARVNTGFNVTLTFSEAVTGLTSTGITATNATVSNLNTTDNITYTATITPVADGAVNVSVPADAAVNTGNNGNTASNTVTITYDVTAPVIANASFNVYDNSTVGTVVGTLTAAETAGTLQNWTLVTDGSGGTFALNAATGAITVKDAALLKSKAGQTFTLTVTVSDGLNTSAAAPVTIKVLIAFINKAPTLDVIADAKVCTGTDTHTIQLTGASATEAGQTYTITAVSNQPFFDALSVNASNVLSYKLKASVTTGTATITVTIKDNGGTDNGGVDTLRRSFTITVNELPSISISSDKGSTISKGDVIHLNATRVNGYTYSWSPADGILSGQNNFILEARPLSNITYVVTATTAAGCSSTADIAITVVEDFKVDAINILTPNGDGRNDKWVIRNLDSYPDNEVSIFDRSGRMIYHRVNYSNDWDATLNGSPLAEGTYYYVLKINGGAKTAKGYITIIRDQH